MNKGDAVLRIQQGLGFRSDRAAEIILALQEEQRDLESGKTLPKFLLKEDQLITVPASTQSVPLPSDFLRRYGNMRRVPAIVGDKRGDIPWVDYDAAQSFYSAPQFYSNYVSKPKVVSERAASLWFSPLSTQDAIFSWSYYARAASLSDNTTNAWLDDGNVPELLIAGAGLRMAADMRNQSAVALFGAMQAAARRALYGEEFQHEADDYLVMGGNR